MPVTSTYPEHPISSHVPNFKTSVELKEHRATDYRKDVERKQAEFEKHQKVVKGAVSRIPDEGYVQDPKYTSIKQKKAEHKRNARTNAGLTEITEEPKAAAGEPGLTWNY